VNSSRDTSPDVLDVHELANRLINASGHCLHRATFFCVPLTRRMMIARRPQPKSFLKYHLMAERTPTSDLSLYAHSLSWKLMADRPPIRPQGALARLRRSIEGLGPYQSLALLLVSITLGEPLKVIAVVFAGDGRWITATVMIIAAYAASLLVGERLFKMVKPKLLTLPWFARIWDWFVAIRRKAGEPFRRS
jgi:hypothetical protein